VTAGPRTAPDASVEAALARAARHARNAAVEALEAVRALLDAAALLTQGVPAGSHAALSRAAEWLAHLAQGIAPEAEGEMALTRALAEALDAEIARWEARAQEDADARAVLRAFLGLRELLWELGVRPPPADPPPGDSRADEPRPRANDGTRRRRVERVPVQG
jgi:ribosomal protein S12 methylthiotransferase accessory factor YcaO